MEIYTDGSANNMQNLQLVDNKTSGFGVCVIDTKYKNITGYYGFNSSTHETSNTGELSGMVFGIMCAIRLNKPIELFSDSMYSIGAYNKYNKTQPVTPISPYNLILINLLYSMKSKHDMSNINVSWVKGHSKLSLGNEIADYLAVKGRKDETIVLDEMMKFFNRKNKNKELFQTINKYKIKLVKLKPNYLKPFEKKIQEENTSII